VNYLLTIVSTILLAINFVLTKRCEICEGTSLEMGLNGTFASKNDRVILKNVMKTIIMFLLRKKEKA